MIIPLLGTHNHQRIHSDPSVNNIAKRTLRGYTDVLYNTPTHFNIHKITMTSYYVLVKLVWTLPSVGGTLATSPGNQQGFHLKRKRQKTQCQSLKN